MDLQSLSHSEARFAAFVGGIASVIGHADRKQPLQDYCVGLIGPSERKSVEPMAAMTAPARVAAQHQSLLHFVGQSEWSDEKVLAKVRELVLPAIERHGPIEVWIIDDTSFRKSGKHSVGVATQYCGAVGREDNCQVAVSLSIANHHASLPVAYRLYLPRQWATDAERRREAGVPAAIRFMSKSKIALQQIKQTLEAGVAPGVVMFDADYGRDSGLRWEVTALGLPYVAAIQSSPLVWTPGTGPKPDRRPPKTREADPNLISVKELALGLGKKAWETIKWREGAAEWLSSRFARLRVRLARGEVDEWLLIEWPKGEKAPTKYWLSTLPEDISFRDLVDVAKMRWRIERDYQELKQEVGLNHYEGRRWRGFHHHATLCIAAYGFLVSERETIPPSGPHSTPLFPQLAVPTGYRPRGSAAAAGAAHRQLDRNDASTSDAHPREASAAMSMLWGSVHRKPPTRGKNERSIIT